MRSNICLLISLFVSLSCSQQQTYPENGSESSPEGSIQTVTEHLKASSRELAQTTKELLAVHRRSAPPSESTLLETVIGPVSLETPKHSLGPQLARSREGAEAQVLFDFSPAFSKLRARYIEQMSLCPEMTRGAALLRTFPGYSLIIFSFDEESFSEILRSTVLDLAWNGCDELVALEQKSDSLVLHRFNPTTPSHQEEALPSEPPHWGKLKLSASRKKLLIQVGKYPKVRWLSLAPQDNSAALVSEKSLLDLEHWNDQYYALERIELSERVSVLDGANSASTPLTLEPQDPGTIFESLHGTPDALLLRERTGLLSSYTLFRKGAFPANPHRLSAPPCSLTLRPTLLPDPERLSLRCSLFSAQPTVLSTELKEARLNPPTSRNRLPEPITAFAPSSDPNGPKIPITLLPHRKGTSQHPSPMLLTTYSAYGEIISPRFSRWWSYLRENGFTIAIVHARGGGYYGANWHMQGSREYKANTAEDLIDAVRYLMKTGSTLPSLLVGYGKSAGAFPFIAVLSKEPELFAGVLLDAPIVSPLEQITTDDPFYGFETQEWGDPNSPHIRELYSETHERFLSGDKQLPPILIKLSKSDERVPAEPVLKWIEAAHEARNGTYVLDMSPTATHSGEPDLYDQLEAEARMIQFTMQSARPVQK